MRQKNILAIDTANEYLSLAIRTRNGNDFTYLTKIGNKQTEHILPEIAALVTKAKITLDELDLIAYNQGPGSFTGLRIGLSVALSLAYSYTIPLIPLPAFLLYATPDTESYANVLVILDARLNQLYVAGINQHNFNYVLEPQICAPAELMNLANQAGIIPQNSVICGHGITVYASDIDEKWLEQFTQVQVEYPSPINMLNLASNNTLPCCSAFEADLLYLRNKVAMNLEEQKQSKIS
jgi:tRNA threonylcarbamoyladenosine biosynthesis protein TsaB